MDKIEHKLLNEALGMCSERSPRWRAVVLKLEEIQTYATTIDPLYTAPQCPSKPLETEDVKELASLELSENTTLLDEGRLRAKIWTTLNNSRKPPISINWLEDTTNQLVSLIQQSLPEMAKKAGREEVVEWIEKHSGRCQCPVCGNNMPESIWQAQLKKWKIKGQR